MSSAVCSPKVTSWFTRLSFFVLVAVGFVAAPTARASAATVATDRVDYAAGEIAIITGSGWEPGEVVALDVTQDPPLLPADTLYTIAEYAVADVAGIIYSGYAVPGHDIPQVFTLTATGLFSEEAAQTTFNNSLDPAALILPPSDATGPTVVTDEPDYMPGETALILGSDGNPRDGEPRDRRGPLAHPLRCSTRAPTPRNMYAGYVVDEHDLDGRSC
jgi:hypothetical protein